MARPDYSTGTPTGLMWATASDPDNDGDYDSTPQGDTDHDWWSTDGRPMRPQAASSVGARRRGSNEKPFPLEVEAASGLPQVQQHTDPNNTPDPEGDQLPVGVAFPLGDNSPSSTFRQEWSTGPDGPQPRTAKADLAAGDAEALGKAAATRGEHPQHKESFPHSKIQHGRYLSAWNETAGLMHGAVGRAAMSRAEYERHTGRGDLHPQYLAAYAQGRRMNSDTSALYRADPEGQATASLRRQADTWSQPHATTDDITPPFNSAATSPDPWSQNEGGGDFQAGLSAGQSDRQAGERPLFADNSSGVSPYVKGYAQGYGGSQGPSGSQDAPASMGGDSGQAQNAQEAQRAFQVARASRTASLRRVSAAFAPDDLMSDPEFRKGYLFASKWRPGQRLAGKGSARFEAGLYAGVTDTPGIQGRWASAHWLQGERHPELRRRLSLHASFTRKEEARGSLRKGAYIQAQAGTSTDLITDGPGTSPDPMGSTPLNGPGAPPPMGGLSDPAQQGGAPPYQGAPPLPGGPVVPDDVMGRPQQQPQPDGPTVQTYSGMHPENAQLAPTAPNKADQSGYTNRDAYQGDPRGNDRLAAFRRRVEAGLVQMGAR